MGARRPAEKGLSAIRAPRGVRLADHIEDLASVDGISQDLAIRIYEALR